MRFFQNFGIFQSKLSILIQLSGIENICADFFEFEHQLFKKLSRKALTN
jgi:hypothetical protein